ncbi:tape measure protein [Spirochaeta cellobiosiphila]|uniref:tape measure protein n=1 Tax=Spirochaeta cellobiosiphila TaxID=504483 RepID=UPI0003F798ED|nr:tape measure protein [Spirochaeta cellobiosiphila]
MASKIELEIIAQSKKAIEDMKKFGNELSYTEDVMQKFKNSAKESDLRGFETRLLRSATAANYMGGQMSSLRTTNNMLSGQIKRMIKSGIDPNDKAIKKLSITYKKNEAQIKKLIIQDKALAVAKKAGQGAALGTVAALTAVTVAGMKGAAEFERYRKEFGVLFKDMAKGASYFEKLQKFSANTPLQMDGLSNTTKTLRSYGTEIKDLIPQIQMLGDTALGNQEKLDSLARGFGKIQTKGKASMEELNIIIDAGIPILDELSKQLNVSKSDLLKMVTQGKVSFDNVNQAFKSMTSEGGQFHNGMKELSTTLSGKLSTAMDNVKIAGATTFEPAIEGAGEALDALTELSKNYVAFLKQIRGERSFDFSELDEAKKKVLQNATSYEDLGYMNGMSKGIYEAAKATENWAEALKKADEAYSLENQIRQLKKLDETRTESAKISIQSALNDLNSGIGEGDWWDTFDTVEEQFESAVDSITNDMGQLLEGLGGKDLRIAIASGDVEVLKKALENLELINPDLKEMQDRLNQLQSGKGIITPEKQEDPYEGKTWRDWSEDILGFGQGTGAANAESFIETINTGLETQSAIAQSLGEEFDLVGAKQEKIKAVIQKLLTIPKDQIDQAFRIDDNTIQRLVEAYNLLESANESSMLDQMYKDASEQLDKISIQEETLATARKKLIELETTGHNLSNQALDEEIKKYEIIVSQLEDALDIKSKMSDSDKSMTDYAKNSAESGELGEVGQLATGADPITLIVQALVDFATSIEGVNEVLNPFATIFEGMRSLIGPELEEALRPVVYLLHSAGNNIAKLLVPPIRAAGFAIKVLVSAIEIIQTPTKFLADIFMWAGNNIVATIEYITSFGTRSNFTKFNSNAFSGLDDRLDYIWNGASEKEKERAEKSLELIEDQIDTEKEKRQELLSAIDEWYDNEIYLLRRELDNNLISQTDYTNTLKDLQEEEEKRTDAVEAASDLQLEQLESQKELIQSNIELIESQAMLAASLNNVEFKKADGPLDAALSPIKAVTDTVGSVVKSVKKFFGFDVGTSNVPKDMFAMVHQGEGIIPKTFNEGIKSGDYTLVGKKQNLYGLDQESQQLGGNQQNITINLNGSIVGIEDLYSKIKAIENNLNRKRIAG